MAAAVLAAAAPAFRITSYNVCYTKLLRTKSQGLYIGASLEGAVIEPDNQRNKIYYGRAVTLVITSHSIHYTKLYDSMA